MKTNTFVLPNKVSISLHPNPTSDYFQVMGIEDTAQVTISDLNCRVLLKTKIVGNENISINTFKKGVYIAKITTENNMVERKLIKT